LIGKDKPDKRGLFHLYEVVTATLFKVFKESDSLKIYKAQITWISLRCGYKPCESCDSPRSNCLIYIKSGNMVKKSGKLSTKSGKTRKKKLL